MSSWRVAPALAAAALALAPIVAGARVPIVIYPFRVPGLSAAQRTDFHAILEAGLASASRRGVLSPRSPALLPRRCGDRPASSCLAEWSNGALVLTGRGEIRSGVVLVTASLVDPKGVRTREVRFLIDLVIQNLRPVGDSIRELEIEIGPDGLVARDDRPPPAAAPPPAPKPPSLAVAPPPQPPAAAPAPSAAPSPAAPPPAPPPKPAAAARVSVEAPSRAPPPLWKRKAGPWLTGVGVALLAGGAAVGLLNRDLANDLDGRYANRQITADDRAAYDRVNTYNVVSTTLFAAGGAAVAAGAWIWISAPAAPGQPAVVGAGGRF